MTFPVKPVGLLGVKVTLHLELLVVPICVRLQEVAERVPVSPAVKLQFIDPRGQPPGAPFAVFVTVVVQVVGLPDATLPGEQLTLTLVSAAPSVNVICARDFDPDAVR